MQFIQQEPEVVCDDKSTKGGVERLIQVIKRIQDLVSVVVNDIIVTQTRLLPRQD